MPSRSSTRHILALFIGRAQYSSAPGQHLHRAPELAERVIARLLLAHLSAWRRNLLLFYRLDCNGHEQAPQKHRSARLPSSPILENSSRQCKTESRSIIPLHSAPIPLPFIARAVLPHRTPPPRLPPAHHLRMP